MDPKLTDREQQVLRLLHHNFRTKDVAQHLGISSNTVRNHLRNIREKLGARNAVELIFATRKDNHES